ncbi:hypothetical protein C4577_06025 [Candidatus Parcubacteria bacterium]|nr:MAG: hypothetical protein C4577_06025 [Candidatus Parcubacteria bacterium]
MFDFQPNGFTFLFFIIYIWTIFWKAVALWRAAKNEQKYWFIIFILPINTMGILELIYLFRFAKKRLTLEQIKSWFSKPQS